MASMTCWRANWKECHPERSEGSRSRDPSPSSRLRMAALKRRHFLEILREGHHPAARLLPIEIFVRSVIAVFRQRKAEEQDGRFEVALHRDHRADRTSFTHEHRLATERKFDRAVNFHRGRGPNPLHHLDRIFGANRFEEVIALELLDREAGGAEFVDLAL